MNGKDKTLIEAPDAPVKAFDVAGGRLEGFTFRNFNTFSAPLVKVYQQGFLVGCGFLNNKQATGRGVVCCSGCTVSRCVFMDNDSSGQVYGSPLASDDSQMNYVENCLFDSNRSGYGGAVNMHSGKWTFRNCDFFRNWSGMANGSAYGDWDFIYDNGKSPVFYNCIVQWSPFSPASRTRIRSFKCSNVSQRPAYHNCQVGGIELPDYEYINAASSSGNLNVPDAGFVDARVRDYRLTAGSAMIGRGVLVEYSDDANLDLAGKPRAAVPSIGCYEYDPDYLPETPVLFVSPSGDGSDGSSWTKAFKTPADALAVAADGTDIKVGEGVYEVEATLKLTKAVRLIGVAGRDKTTLKAASAGYRLIFLKNEGAVVQGFTIREGDLTTATGAGDPLVHDFKGGAGVGICPAGGSLLDCRVTDCCDDDSESFGKHASSALSATGGSIARCVFDGNVGNAVVTLFANNQGHPPMMYDCLVVNNTVKRKKPAVRVRDPTEETWSSFYPAASDLEVCNCTVVGNTGAACAIGRDWSSARICNTVMSNVEKETQAWLDESPDAETATNGTSTVWRNCASYVSVGTNCVSGVDLKMKSNGGLRWSSPCKGAGLLQSFVWGTGDVNGNPRTIEIDGEEVVDIGCYQLGTYGPGLMLLVR